MSIEAQLPAMYTDLAQWWPLLSPPEDYVDEAAMIAGLLRAALARRPGSPRPVLLELGSGGGHNAVHLAADFEPVLVDASAQMLEVSRRLNPDLEHHLGDMRGVRLGRTVDAVLIHDAIGYLLTESDLDAAFATARAHLGPAGVAVIVPDHTRETFRPGTEHGGSDSDGSMTVTTRTVTTRPPAASGPVRGTCAGPGTRPGPTPGCVPTSPISCGTRTAGSPPRRTRTAWGCSRSRPGWSFCRRTVSR